MSVCSRTFRLCATASAPARLSERVSALRPTTRESWSLDSCQTVGLEEHAEPAENGLPHEGQPAAERAALLAEWEQGRLYQRIQQSRAGAPTYVLHDGPPYPTGTIHLGTGLNKILKDMVVKSKTMAGFRAPYVPGWDCHGLPIETQVEKELGGRRAACRRRSSGACAANLRCATWISTGAISSALGVLGRWEDPYLTMEPQLRSLHRRGVPDVS